MTSLLTVNLGRCGYGDVLALQRELCQARLHGGADSDVLLLVEHPDVITLGRGTQPSSLPHDPSALRRLGYQVHEIERGGDVTYHGPGQLVGYPILDLRLHREDLHWYLRQLEAVLIDVLATFDVPGERVDGLTGVWTQGRKIASIGIHVKQWITFHGFALNVTTDLSRFESIVPCGIDNVVMTSIAHELGRENVRPSLWSEAVTAVVDAMGRTFDRDATLVPLETLPQFGFTLV
ncbi:MAG: lipoyl(octanoyl) transferase LipB [Gemmatimonadetes bacterium]|nr:lipoyl(octanoyl) transferase LipB [Gemmatimonadota bacterium]